MTVLWEHLHEVFCGSGFGEDKQGAGDSWAWSHKETLGEEWGTGHKLSPFTKPLFPCQPSPSHLASILEKKPLYSHIQPSIHKAEEAPLGRL